MAFELMQDLGVAVPFPHMSDMDKHVITTFDSGTYLCSHPHVADVT
jgi:hypothetical protein